MESEGSEPPKTRIATQKEIVPNPPIVINAWERDKPEPVIKPEVIAAEKFKETSEEFDKKTSELYSSTSESVTAVSTRLKDFLESGIKNAQAFSEHRTPTEPFLGSTAEGFIEDANKGLDVIFGKSSDTQALYNLLQRTSFNREYDAKYEAEMAKKRVRYSEDGEMSVTEDTTLSENIANIKLDKVRQENQKMRNWLLQTFDTPANPWE